MKNCRTHKHSQIARRHAGHAGTHAAGVVISKDPITEYVPLQKNDAYHDHSPWGF